MVTCCVLRADVLPHVGRTEVPKHRHVLQFALSTFFGLVNNARQCFAITALLSGLVSRSSKFSSTLTLRTPNFLDLTSSCIHVLQSTNPLSVEAVFGGLRINGQRWLHLVTQVSQQRHDSFRLAPNAAAYSSASALFLAMIFCLRVYAFKVSLPSSFTPAIDDVRVFLKPAQSESENVFTSSTILPRLSTCVHCLSRLNCLTSLFNLARLCCVGFDIL